MRKSVKILLLAAALVLVVGAAALGYSILKEKTDIQQFQGAVSDSSQEAGQDSSTSGSSSEESGSDGEESGQQQTYAAMDFTVYDGEGNPVSLSDLKGKPVIVNFWATWCGYCKQEMPDFEEIYQRYGDQVEIMMVHITESGETKEQGQEYIQKEGFTFPVYYDLDQNAAQTYYISSLPQTMLVDAEGNIAGYAQGMVTLEALENAVTILLEE